MSRWGRWHHCVGSEVHATVGMPSIDYKPAEREEVQIKGSFFTPLPEKECS